ncbi:hypothetical protein DFJ58DRAFT_748993 [Suillus subalutaceus]|uniref:uncharacterized protein n=1 Tax=Suillus subalutaceus TaxID=48586 RepID=UPI001B881731|nr:uncharacterized protein DFJ58DRAFT_748993 [Suillus subalutaceus]KAG1839563.1 hypothetical protein DFJ58DRAFT_748993 [Suillus subalutaceus]
MIGVAPPNYTELGPASDTFRCDVNVFTAAALVIFFPVMESVYWIFVGNPKNESMGASSSSNVDGLEITSGSCAIDRTLFTYSRAVEATALESPDTSSTTAIKASSHMHPVTKMGAEQRIPVLDVKGQQPQLYDQAVKGGRSSEQRCVPVPRGKGILQYLAN